MTETKDKCPRCGWPDETVTRQVFNPASQQEVPVLVNRYEVHPHMLRGDVIDVLIARTDYLLSLRQENDD